MKPVRKAKATVRRRPAETAAPGVWVALTATLSAFGVEPTRAAAVSGLVAAVTPMVVTYFHARMG
jgi:hypothetical protein